MPTRFVKHILMPMIAAIAMLAAAPDAAAQRRVTPVRPAEPGTSPAQQAPSPGRDLTRLVHMHDAQGNPILVDTVTGEEVADTSLLLAAPPKMEYPLIYTASVGVNVWDALMRVFGQDFGIGAIEGEFNMHNRYLVGLTAGLGTANVTPADKNFTFTSPVSPYFKVSAAYNFLYNSNPDYKLMIGLTYGLSPFKWTLENVTVPDSYWQDPTAYSLPTLSHTTGWLEVSLGIRVRIAGPWSAGWRIIYQAVLHDSSSPYGQPMYIPGYGKRSNPLAAALTVSYTFSLSGRKKVATPAAPDSVTDSPPEPDITTPNSLSTPSDTE